MQQLLRDATSKDGPSPQRAALVMVLSLLLLPGCQQDMARQPSYRPDEESAFFSDGRADRPLPPGTVARGHLRSDLHLFTGRRDSGKTEQSAPPAAKDQKRPTTAPDSTPSSVKELLAAMARDEDNYVDTFPFPITYEVLKHGQNRYMIYCVVCHDPLGTGHGKIVERGYTPPPSYHIERLRRVPVGYLFAVITNGYGSMPDYRHQVPPGDRWAI